MKLAIMLYGRLHVQNFPLCSKRNKKGRKGKSWEPPDVTRGSQSQASQYDCDHDCVGLRSAGDHGDPDLQVALAHAASAGKPVALVVFGHMHHLLSGRGRRRNMVHIDENSGTVLINCAFVPRLTPAAGNTDTLHHFTVVTLVAEGHVETASHVWVSVNGDQCQVTKQEHIVWTTDYQHGKPHRNCLNTGDLLATAGYFKTRSE